MKRKIIGGVILGLALVSLLVAAALKSGDGMALQPRSYNGGSEVVGIIDISGTIMAGGAQGFFGEEMGADGIMMQLRQAADDPSVKAVVLRLNSPGGTVAATQEITTEVIRLKKSGKKVVASMGDVAASGAYWIAANADVIVANPATVTGSIGVRMDMTDLRGLYEKLGVGSRTIKSGPYKDMGSANREMTPEEKKIFQAMVDDMYAQFVDNIAKGRNMNLQEVKKLADGRVFTGRQAKELGLVDELGNFYDAIRLAGEISGLGPEPETTGFGNRGFWQDLLGSAGARPPAMADPTINDLAPLFRLVF